MSSCASRGRSSKKENCFSTVCGIDRLVRQCSLCIKSGQQRSQIFIAIVFVECYVVLREGCNDPFTGEHSRTLYHCGRADTVYPNPGSKSNGKLTNKMAQSRLAYVVSLTASLGHDCIRRARQNDADAQILCAKELCCLIRKKKIRRHIHLQRLGPLIVSYDSIGRSGENGGGVYCDVKTTELSHSLAERIIDCFPIANINRSRDGVLLPVELAYLSRYGLSGFGVAVRHHYM